MIRPEGFRGAAFGTLADGDLRYDDAARARVAGRLGIPSQWAFVTQVHGDTVIAATHSGPQGEADAIFTSTAGLPLAVATADCVPIIIEGPQVVAVIHAGWRGAAAGVVGACVRAMERAGLEPRRAAIGPAIGPECYEVGDEVAAEFPRFLTTTTWGTRSIDLPSIVADQLGALDVWRSDLCTYTSDDYASYRRNRTKLRQTAVAWLPQP